MYVLITALGLQGKKPLVHKNMVSKGSRQIWSVLKI